MSDDKEKPKLVGLPGGGEADDPSVRKAKAILGVVGPETGADHEQITISLLKKRLVKIENSGLQTDEEIFKLHQAMVLAGAIDPKNDTDSRRLAATTLERAPVGLSSQEWAIIIDDSITELASVYDFMEAEFFSRTRQENMASQLLHRSSVRTGILQESQQLKTHLIDSFMLSHDLLTMEAGALGQTPHDLLNSLQNQLLKQAGLFENPADFESASAYMAKMNALRREAWGKFSKLSSHNSGSGA